MRLTITIDLDNAAFADDIGDPNEVRRILNDAADRIDIHRPQSAPINLRDFNGNHVGTAVVTA